MSFLSANDLTLHAAWDGPRAGLPLVFVNSLGTTFHLWDPLLPHLPSGHPLVRYDKRGHGLSDAPPAPYTLGDHSRDLTALLDVLEIEHCVLVGISVGGLIAMDFALQHPARLRGLVLSDTAPRIGTPQAWSDRMQAVQDRGLDAMALAIMERWFAPDFAGRHPADHQGFANMLCRTPLAGYLGTCAALRDADLSESLHRISAPTLVLCGAQDISTPPEPARALAGALPSARFELIEAAAHLPCVEQPRRMAGAMGRFLEEITHVR